MFPTQTLCSSSGIGILFAQILKGGVVRRQCGGPSLRMNAACDEWLSSMGHAYEVVQPEFTWGRVNTETADHASWICEIIDVVGSNLKFYSPKGIRCIARRGDDLPHRRYFRSFGLWVSGGLVRRKHENHKIHLTTSFTDLSHRGCLITQNSNVLQMTVLICGLQTETVGSLVCRPFVGTMYAFASTFLSTHIIIATTARQRLELALTTMRLLERHPIDERRLSRLCAADPDLSAIVELDVDLNVFVSISVPPHVLERLAERCRVPSGPCSRRNPCQA